MGVDSLHSLGEYHLWIVMRSSWMMAKLKVSTEKDMLNKMNISKVLEKSPKMRSFNCSENMLRYIHWSYTGLGL